MFTRHHRAAAGRVLALLALTIAIQAGVAQAAPPTVFNPVVEAQNFSITQQRQAIYDTPGPSEPPCADPTSPIGTRAHGLTSTSSTTRRRTPGS
jgi:hypothetical protein